MRATSWLADHRQHVALGYAGVMGIRELVVRYAPDARGLWLSARPVDERVRLLRELTKPVQTIFFARRRRVVSSVRSEMARLSIMPGHIDGEASDSPEQQCEAHARSDAIS
jgi:hypothetical protein